MVSARIRRLARRCSSHMEAMSGVPLMLISTAMRMSRTVVLGLATLLAFAHNTYAQGADFSKVVQVSNVGGGKMDQPCDYDRCALRLTKKFASWNVSQGVQEAPVAELGWFKAPKLEPLMAAVPNAAAEATKFQRQYTRSSALVWAGSAVAIVGAGVSAAQGGQSFATTVSATALAAVLYGSWRQGNSLNTLSRAIWLYNRELPK